MNSNQNQTGRGLSLLAGAMTFAAYAFFVRPQLLKWGTFLGESQRRLLGDDLIPQSSLNTTHAQNIDAPPEAVWPWLAQMGRERTGFYGLDLWLNAGIPSVEYIRKDIAPIEVGMAMDSGFQVMEVEPNRALLFGGYGLRRPAGIILDQTVLYLLERRRDGSSRLLVRQRAFSYGSLSPLFNAVYEPIYFWFSQQQLAGLKRRAESMAHLQ